MAVYDYTPLYGAGDIVPGTTAAIFQNLGLENPNVPVFRLLGSENKGGTNVNESMNFAAIPGQSYRLVNNATGEVLGEASTPEAISALVEQSNALSKQLGKKADLSFETSTPEVFGGGYSPIFEDQPNILFDTPMKLIAAGMLASLGGGLLQPGGLGGVGATGATGTTGVAGATTAASAAPAVASAAAPTVASAAAPAVFEAAPILVTGTKAASALAPTLLASAAAAPSLLASASPAPQPATAEPIPSSDIVVTAQNQPFLLDSVAPALTSAVASTAIPELTQPAATTAEPKKENITNKSIDKWNISDWLDAAAVGGVGVDLLQQLLGGGGGGAGTAVPYVSPFGPGVGMGGLPAGQDRRVDPNIADYEKYGFGPEAMFFAAQPGPVLAPTTPGPASAMVNPQYVPLI